MCTHLSHLRRVFLLFRSEQDYELMEKLTEKAFSKFNLSKSVKRTILMEMEFKVWEQVHATDCIFDVLSGNFAGYFPSNFP